MELIKHLYLSGCLEHSSITEEERKLFEAYDECRTMLTVLYSQTEFINGFRLGGQLAAEMLLEP